MKVSYRKGIIGENKRIVEMINLGFSDVRENLDFSLSMPKVYQYDMKKEEISHLILEDQEIVACVGNLPTQFNVGGIDLKTYYVGSVSVIPKARNKGYMKRLMYQAIDEMNENKADIALLGGQRQRYEYFNFFQSGNVRIYQIIEANFKHSAQNTQGNYHFRLIENTKDHALKSIYAYYKKRELKQRSEENFLFECQSHRSSLYEITFKNNFFGYIIFRNKTQMITEFELSDHTCMRGVFKDFLNVIQKMKIEVMLMPWELEKIRQITTFSESMTIHYSEQIRIFNYEKFIKAIMELTNRYKTLKNGSFIIEIIDNGRYHLKVEKGMISVSLTKEKADVMLKEEAAIRFLTTYDNVQEYQTQLNWFPLYFAIPISDTF